MLLRIEVCKVFLLLLICSSFASCQDMQKPKNDIEIISSEVGCKIRPNKDSLTYPVGMNNFISELNKIVAAKDFKKLLEKVDPKVTVSYGEAIYGKDEFEIYWRDIKEQELLWEILSRILILGGDVDQYQNEESFVFPYLQIDRFYEGVSIDWFNLGVITKSAVNLVDSSQQKIIDTLNFDIIEIIDRSTIGWTKVRTVCDNKLGWIADENFYACTNYSMVIVRDDNEAWKIKVLSTE